MSNKSQELKMTMINSCRMEMFLTRELKSHTKYNYCNCL